MSEIEVRFFGRLADQFGRTIPLACTAAGLTVHDIREQLGGELTDVIRVKAAVADQLVGEDAIVLPGCSVEFLPPLSGG